MTPEIRIRRLNARAVNPNGDYVLYWMIANRRTRWNFSLERAVEHATELNKPLVVLEALRSGYRWASDRMHRFVLQGMADNRNRLEDANATYYAYVEPEAGHGSGLLDALASKASLVVTDDFPCFFIPRMLKLVAPRMPVLMEAVDSNGILPLRAASQVYPTAYAFRRFLQKELRNHLEIFPRENSLARKKLPTLKTLPKTVRDRWPEATDKQLLAETSTLVKLPINHNVKPAVFDGGEEAARRATKTFLADRLHRYKDDRNEPTENITSGLSPYLHFGHISAHEVFQQLARQEGWSIDSLGEKAAGKREGWWGMSPAAEGFLDELITWREVGYNMCWQWPNYDRYESLPEWARTSLELHESDPRENVYSLVEFETASTHNRLWNAAQMQLVTEGRMHNYMRMVWGKKILHWTESPRDALRIMVHLNNKYAVDGRNPNSYSGIFWCLGRYDRAWGPERPIFGKIRYMATDNTARKLKVGGYMDKYAPEEQQRLFS